MGVDLECGNLGVDHMGNDFVGVDLVGGHHSKLPESVYRSINLQCGFSAGKQKFT